MNVTFSSYNKLKPFFFSEMSASKIDGSEKLNFGRV